MELLDIELYSYIVKLTKSPRVYYGLLLSFAPFWRYLRNNDNIKKELEGCLNIIQESSNSVTLNNKWEWDFEENFSYFECFNKKVLHGKYNSKKEDNDCYSIISQGEFCMGKQVGIWEIKETFYDYYITAYYKCKGRFDKYGPSGLWVCREIHKERGRKCIYGYYHFYYSKGHVLYKRVLDPETEEIIVGYPIEENKWTYSYIKDLDLYVERPSENKTMYKKQIYIPKRLV